MLRCLDPNATWLHELPGQDDVPAANRVRLRCRYLTLAKQLAYRELREEATRVRGAKESIEALFSALRLVIVAVENPPMLREDVSGLAVAAGSSHAIGSGATGDASCLMDCLSGSELFELAMHLEYAQHLSEIERSKSEWPSPGAAGASAPRAEEAAGA